MSSQGESHYDYDQHPEDGSMADQPDAGSRTCSTSGLVPSEEFGIALPYPSPHQRAFGHSSASSLSHPSASSPDHVGEKDASPEGVDSRAAADPNTCPPTKHDGTGARSALGRIWRRLGASEAKQAPHNPASSLSSPSEKVVEITEACTNNQGKGLSPSIGSARTPAGDTVQQAGGLDGLGEKTAVHRPTVRFHSRRVKGKDRDTSWLAAKKDPRQKWLSIFPLAGLFLGLCLSGVNVWVGWRSIPVHRYCLVYEDDFSSGSLNKDIWLQEVQTGGFGNGQFDVTTADDENVFIKDNMLHIEPTLQDEYLLTHNATLNLLELGTCTATSWSDCVATTNTTNGTIINPVKSGRINTSKGANLRFGRVEVVAKFPQGDWIWPAIWLYPTNSVYGTWPASGEIDIAESRGNNWTYPSSGNDVISSTFHWGPNTANDGWWRTYHKEQALHSSFADHFHTYGLEWNEKYMYTYLDSRLRQVLYQKFGTPFWKFGQFAGLSLPTVGDIWRNGTVAAPFDQDFFLILDVAVGGTNGWFSDGAADKPWEDSSSEAKKQFWEARDQWYPTWQNDNGPGMKVKSVKMWQQQGYHGCGDNAQRVP